MKISEKMNKMIIAAEKRGTTDISLHPVGDKVEVKHKVGGKFITKEEITPLEHNEILRWVKFKTRLDISVTRKPQNGAFYLNDENNNEIFAKVSTTPLLNGESLGIRILPDKKYEKFNEIELVGGQMEEIEKTIKNNSGLFIFTGPSGSGKTTSIYSLLNKIKDEEDNNIITLENPIEIIDNNFIQMQINENINLTYSVGIRAAMKNNPDVLLVGEIEDKETAQSIMKAALGGATIISTMAAKNKNSVIDRLLDYGFMKSEIESALIGISDQRLVYDENNNSSIFFDYSLDKDIENLFRENNVGVDVVTIESKLEKELGKTKKTKEKER